MPLDEIDITIIEQLLNSTVCTMGFNVRMLRKERNITQEDLAFYINSNKSVISNLERGVCGNITLSTIIKICYVLDVNIKDLLYVRSLSLD